MSYHHKVARGKDHGLAKLTPTRVRNLRRRKEAGASVAQLARDYGVSPSTVRLIIKRITWTHV